MTKQEFTDTVQLHKTEPGLLFIYTKKQGQQDRDCKSVFGRPKPGESINSIMDIMFQILKQEYPEGIDDVVAVTVT